MTTRSGMMVGIVLVAIQFACSEALCQMPQSTLAIEPGQYYVRGVHAYFAGRSSEAEQYLSQAMAIDPNDPRACYFRGLAKLRMGRRQDALIDMQIGASIEAQQPGEFSMGRTLERVQGSDRLLLERIRRDGQIAAASARAEQRNTRNEPIVSREVEMLYQPGAIALDQLLATGQSPALLPRRWSRPVPAWSIASLRTAQPAAAAGATGNPFPDDPVSAPSGSLQSMGTGAPSTPAPRPLASPSASSGVDENPFAAPARPTAPPQPATTSPATNSSNPFSENPVDDPFGG